MSPRRPLLVFVLLGLALSTAGDLVVHAASCRPYAAGICNACKNCKYCGHCAKSGGSCSVCRR